MSEREKLDALMQVLGNPGSVVPLLSELETPESWMARAILASDWLRDTLAAERRDGFIKGLETAEQDARGWAKGWDTGRGHSPVRRHTLRVFARNLRLRTAAIRNLGPKESDDARG
jgi:hypothetical protein